MESPDDVYVIWSYEHQAWWRPGRWGYTPLLDQAGRYSKAEADQIVAHANIVQVNEVAMLEREAHARFVARRDRATGRIVIEPRKRR